MVRRVKAKLVLELRAEGMTGRGNARAQGMSRKSVLAAFNAADRAERCDPAGSDCGHHVLLLETEFVKVNEASVSLGG